MIKKKIVSIDNGLFRVFLLYQIILWVKPKVTKVTKVTQITHYFRCYLFYRKTAVPLFVIDKNRPKASLWCVSKASSRKTCLTTYFHKKFNVA